MGVTVLHIFPDQQRSGHKEIERLTSRIHNLGAEMNGMFSVDCETYYTNTPSNVQQSVGTNPATRKLHILHHSEMPCSTYAIIDTGTKQVTLSADLLLDFLLPRLSHMYQAKKNLKLESTGGCFKVGDFIVKIGTVTMTSHYKGILIEVEYLPCAVPALCWSLVREFMQSFIGSSVSSQPPNYIQNHFNEVFTPQDVIRQYLEKFTEFREGVNFPSSTMAGTSATPISSS